MQLPPKDPFSFPYGRMPGYDPNHIALANGGVLRFAYVPCANSLNLLSLFPKFTRGTATGTIVSSTYAVVGPVVGSSAAGGGNRITFPSAPTPTASDPSITIACFFVVNSAAEAHFLVNNNTATYIGLGCTGSAPNRVAFRASEFGSFRAASNVTITTGVPYFVAASASTSGSCYFAITNLYTGQVFLDKASNTTMATGGTVTAISDTGSFSLNGYLGPGAITSSYLNQQQLMSWAEDPWSFWYPNTDDNIFATLVGASVTDTLFAQVWM